MTQHNLVPGVFEQPRTHWSPTLELDDLKMQKSCKLGDSLVTLLMLEDFLL